MDTTLNIDDVRNEIGKFHRFILMDRTILWGKIQHVDAEKVVIVTSRNSIGEFPLDALQVIV